MIIECPSCTSRYRIREDKLPEAGGNIKCPNCAHIFFVPRVASASASGSAPVVPDTEAGPPGPVATVAATAAVPAPAAGARRWKLKNPVGLVYDFQDTQQLRSWLKSRDTFDGFLVSDDAGATWKAVDAFEELADVTPTGKPSIGPQAAMRLNRSGDQKATSPAPAESFPSTAEQMRDAAQARLREARKARKPTESGIVTKAPRAFHTLKQPENPEAKKASQVLLLVAVIILPLVAGIALHAGGVIDLADFGLLPSGLRAPDYVPPTYRADEREQRDERPEMTVEQAVNLLMRQASAAQSRGELSLAADFIEQASEVDPSDLELWCLLQPIYVELGRGTDAEAAGGRCAQARAIEAGEVAPDGSGAGAPPDGSGAVSPPP